MMWRYIDGIVNRRFEEFSQRDLKTIEFSSLNRRVKKYYLADETLNRIRDTIAKSEEPD